MEKYKSIFIIGAGSWGCALASLLVENNYNVLVYDVDDNIVNEINCFHTNSKLPNVKLNKRVKATNKLEDITNDYDIVLLAVPTKVVRLALKNLACVLKHKVLFINVAKGIEIGSNKRISEIVYEEIDNKFIKGFVSLTGPSHAEEVVERKLTLVTSASLNIDDAKLVQKIFSNNEYFRVYTSTDLIGAELCGALKNVYAVASGISSGLGYGVNASAALITRSLAEIKRFVNYFGGDDKTLLGLTGVGDMIVTCTSNLSRNFQAGYMIGQGENLEEALSKITMVVEGANTCVAAYNIAKEHNLYAPIITAVYNVIYLHKNPKQEIINLLNSELKEEFI